MKVNMIIIDIYLTYGRKSNDNYSLNSKWCKKSCGWMAGLKPLKGFLKAIKNDFNYFVSMVYFL